MIGLLVNEMKEAVETKELELSAMPEFFYELQEIKENPDEPVTSVETSEMSHSYLITRNEGLEGDVHPMTGVAFERQIIELGNGEIVEGVFPEFESVFDAQIPEDLYSETDYKQFKCCNEQLLEAIENNSELRAKFSREQLNQITEGVSDGAAPDGYVWHHSPEPGKIQLVDFEIHAQTGHTGGRSVWGGGSENR